MQEVQDLYKTTALRSSTCGPRGVMAFICIFESSQSSSAGHLHVCRPHGNTVMVMATNNWTRLDKMHPGRCRRHNVFGETAALLQTNTVSITVALD